MNTNHTRDPKTGKLVRKAQPQVHEDDNRRIADYSDGPFYNDPIEYEQEQYNTGVAVAIAFAFVFAFIVIVIAFAVYYIFFK